MTKLSTAHAATVQESKAYHIALEDLKSVLGNGSPAYAAMVSILDETKTPGFWAPQGLDGETPVSHDTFMTNMGRIIQKGFQGTRPNDDTMLSFTAALAALHGVSAACRDTMPERYAFFTANPEQWRDRLNIVCKKIDKKMNPKPLFDADTTFIAEGLRQGCGCP